MHDTALDYVRSVRDRLPDFFTLATVVEYGSRDVNGTPRDLFSHCVYVGVDRSPGDGVDVVSRMHELVGCRPADTVVTISAMEHDKHLEKSLEMCWHILAKGGLFVGTTVNKDWPVHSVEEGEDGHYEGVDAEWLRGFFAERSTDFEVKEGGIKNREIFFFARKTME